MAWYPIREEPLLLLCPADLEGATVESLLTAAPFIRMDRNSWVAQIVTRFLEVRAIRTEELFEMDAPQAMVILVARGVGVTLLPDWGIADAVGSVIQRLPIGDRSYNRQLGVLGLRGARARLIDSFVAALRAGIGATLPS